MYSQSGSYLLVVTLPFLLTRVNASSLTLQHRREADTNEPGEPGAWNRNVVFTLGISCWECLILHRICVVYSGHGPLGDFTHTTGSVVTNGVLPLYCSTNSPSILTFFLPYLLVLSPLTSTSSTTPLPLKRLLKRPLRR
jgi:hypothetical protein